MIERPSESEFASFYKDYVSAVTEPDVLAVLESQIFELQRLTAAVPAQRETFRYAPGKWSVREVVGHLTDGERVFGYRAFRISRGDQTPLPGFDEKSYVLESGFDQRPLAELVDEFIGQRRSNLVMLRRLDRRALERIGTANDNPISVRALAFIMAGHVRHHFGVLRTRYDLATTNPT